MPPPLSVRRQLEQELTELPGQIATNQRDPAATLAEDKTRREMLDWQIRRAQKRLTEIEARLAAMRAEGP